MSPVKTAAPGLTGSREVGRNAIDCAIGALELLRDRLADDDLLGGQFERTVGRLLDLQGKVLTMGIGKSGHAAQKVAGTLRSVGVPAVYMSAADLLHGDLGLTAAGDLALLFSKSGATRELLAISPHLRARSVALVAVVGNPDSPLARTADLVLDASVRAEGCPLDSAPMASVIAAQALGDALASAVISERGFTTEDFAQLHPAGALGARLTLSVSAVMRRGADHPRVALGASLKDAVIEITRTGYGAVCVLDPEQRLAGLLTDGDVRRALLAIDDLAGTGVRELMTVDPLVVGPDLPLSEALARLERRSKPYMTAPVVLADNRCVGLLRLHDVIQAHMVQRW